jgi:hypothetical protein
MAYVGQTPLTGAYQLCDTITTSATATYNLTINGVAVTPVLAQNCIVSLNGVIQAPVSGFTISGSTIIFSSALTTADVINFILILGSVGSIGTPTNGTVTTNSLASGFTLPSTNGGTGQTSFTTGDIIYSSSGNTLSKLPIGSSGQGLVVSGGVPAWGTSGPSAGQVIQVLSATDSTYRTTTSTSFVTGSNTLSVTITPSSSSNKIFIIVSTGVQLQSAAETGYFTIYRGATNLGTSTGMFACETDSGGGGVQPFFGGNYLDSPATTSATTYQVYMRKGAGSNGTGLNYSSTRGSITVMEIKG